MMKNTDTGYHMGKRVLGDYDIWYKSCDYCGFDTGKSTKKSEARCWKCGRPIKRDYSDRALKTKRQR